MRVNNTLALSLLAILCMILKSFTVRSSVDVSLNINHTSAASVEVGAELPSNSISNAKLIEASSNKYSSCYISDDKVINGPILSEASCQHILKKERIIFRWEDADDLKWTAMLEKAFSDVLCKILWDPSDHYSRRRRRCRPPRAIRKKYPGLKRKTWRNMPRDLRYLLSGCHQKTCMPEFIGKVVSVMVEELKYWVSYGVFWIYHGIFYTRFVIFPQIQEIYKMLNMMWKIFILSARHGSLYYALWVMLPYYAEYIKKIMKKRSSRVLAFFIFLLQCTLVVAQPTRSGKSFIPAAAVAVGAGIVTAGAAAVAMHKSMSESERNKKRRRMKQSGAATSGEEHTRKGRKRKKKTDADDPRATSSNFGVEDTEAAGEEASENVTLESPRVETATSTNSGVEVNAEATGAADKEERKDEASENVTLDPRVETVCEPPVRDMDAERAVWDKQRDGDGKNTLMHPIDSSVIIFSISSGNDERKAGNVEENDEEMESEEADTPTVPPKRRCRSSLTGAAAMSGAERFRNWKERQKRKAEEASGVEGGKQCKTAKSGAERTKKWREQKKKKAEEEAAGSADGQDGMKVDNDEDELVDIALGLDEAIKERVRECQELLASNEVEPGIYQSRVCVVCDRFIKLTDEMSPISKENLLQFEDKLGVKRYEDHYGRKLKQQLKEQYQVADKQLHGLLLSPRSRCREDGRYDACRACHRSLKSKNVKSPPKFSISNGFVIGSIPEVLKYCTKEGKKIVYEFGEKKLTDLLCAMIAVVRPFGYVFSYTANAFNSIKGHITFFDMDQQYVGGVINYFRQIRKSNVFCVLCGRMTPTQKEAVRKRSVLDTGDYLNLLSWFIEASGHPAYQDVTTPEKCPKPHVVVDPETQNNTNKEEKTANDEETDASKEESTFEGNSYYFASSEDPDEGTSVFGSTKMFVKAMLNGNSPQMFVYGGKYASRKELHLQDICPVQFPFGLGGPNEDRECTVSQEECLKHYLQLSLRQFMRGDFILIAYHIYNRIISYHTGIIKSRTIKKGIDYASRASKLTEQDFKDAGQRKADDKPDYTKAADEFLRDVTTSTKKIGHSPEAAKDALRNAMAMNDFFGCHSIFCTITPDDLCTFRVNLRVHAGEKVRILPTLLCDNSNTYAPHSTLIRFRCLQRTLPSLDGKATADADDVFDIDFKLRSEDRLNYPGACALEYEDILALVIKGLFNWDKKTQTGKMGIVGELEGFGVATEEQCRKSLHGHYTLWVKHFNENRDSLFHDDKERRERARENMLNYVDEVMSASYGNNFKMMHSCDDSEPVPVNVADVLHADDEFPPPDEEAKERLEKMRRARHKDHCHDINGEILSCKECGKEFSPADIINNVLHTWQHQAQQEATSDQEEQEWSPVQFPLTQEHLDVAAYRFSTDFDIASGECKIRHDHPLFNDFLFRKILLHLRWNEHAATHCRTCFKKNNECRFFFPHPIRLVTSFDEGDLDDETWKGLTFHKLDGSTREARAYNIVPARHHGSQYLNTHNDALSMLLGCNTNSQIGAEAHTFYAMCYTYKNTQAEDSEMYMKVVNQITKHLIRRKEQEQEELRRSREAGEQQPATNDDQAPAAAGDYQAAPADTTDEDGRASEGNQQQPATNNSEAPAETEVPEAPADDDQKAPTGDDDDEEESDEDRANFIKGLSLFLSAFYAQTSRYICSSPLAHFIMMNGGSRFIFSHEFVELPVVQMVDLLEGKGTRYRWRKTKSKKGEVKMYPDCYADNYRYRPPELEGVCFYDQMMRYDRGFYKFKEIDGSQPEKDAVDEEEEVEDEVEGFDEEDMVGDGEDEASSQQPSKKDNRLRFSKDHPGYEFAFLKERKLVVIPRVSLPEGQLCPIKDLNLDKKEVATGVLHELREDYAKHALIMFYPFRELSDLQLNDRYWDKFMHELDRIQNPQKEEDHEEESSSSTDAPRFWPKGVEILQNIDTQKSMGKLPRPDDILKRSTEGDGDCEEMEKEADPFLARMGEFDHDFDRDPFEDWGLRDKDQPLSFSGIIGRSNIHNHHLKRVHMAPGASSVFISDDDDDNDKKEGDGKNADNASGSESVAQSSHTQEKPSSSSPSRDGGKDDWRYATVLEFLCGSVVGDACYSYDDDVDDEHKEEERNIGGLRLPTLEGVAKKVEKKEGKMLDEKQYIAYEILCCSFILELVESGELTKMFAIDASDKAAAEKNKKKLVANLKARCAERHLTMFLTGPAGSGKSTAVDVAQRYCYEVSLALNITWENSFLFTSTTGSSAALFGGVTIHSAACLMKKLENITDDDRERFKHVRLLIVDEISYFSKTDVRNLDKCLRKIRERKDKIFGGLPIVFCGDFHQLLPVSANTDHLLFSSAKGDNYWRDIITTIVVLQNKHRFKDDPEFGELLTRMWEGRVTEKDLNKINERVIGTNGLKLPSSMDGDVSYACPSNNERNSVNRGLFRNHVMNTCPEVTSDEDPPEHTVLIEAFIHSEKSNEKGNTKGGKKATTRVPSFMIDCILTQCGDSDVRNGTSGGGAKIDPALPCYPGAQMMATNNRYLKKLGVGNGTVCTVVGIKLKDGARMKWRNWEGRKVNTVLATEVEYILLRHSPAETPKMKALQSKISELKKKEKKDGISEEEQQELRNLGALLQKEEQSRCFKLKPQNYTAEVSVSMIPEVARTGKTRTPFRFYQFPLNTNDATTGHKLQGMSKDQLIVTSWDGISKWPNWAYTVISRVRKLEGLFLCKPLTSSVSFELPDDLVKYESYMLEKERTMMKDRERKLNYLKDRNEDLNL